MHFANTFIVLLPNYSNRSKNIILTDGMHGEFVFVVQLSATQKRTSINVPNWVQISMQIVNRKGRGMWESIFWHFASLRVALRLMHDLYVISSGRIAFCILIRNMKVQLYCIMYSLHQAHPLHPCTKVTLKQGRESYQELTTAPAVYLCMWLKEWLMFVSVAVRADSDERRWVYLGKFGVCLLLIILCKHLASMTF